jgi:hypothetical protein
MSGRETLLAEIEARRRAQAKKNKTDQVEILAADLSLAPEDTSYNPYDKPGAAKPLDLDGDATIRRKALRNKNGR